MYSCSCYFVDTSPTRLFISSNGQFLRHSTIGRTIETLWLRFTRAVKIDTPHSCNYGNMNKKLAISLEISVRKIFFRQITSKLFITVLCCLGADTADSSSNQFTDFSATSHSRGISCAVTWWSTALRSSHRYQSLFL